jgi:hypothetical protein
MAEEHQREATYWRDLLTRIAEDLEHAAGVEREPRRRSWLSSRAMRIRQRLHEGVPSAFEETQVHAGMTPRDHVARRDVSAAESADRR